MMSPPSFPDLLPYTRAEYGILYFVDALMTWETSNTENTVDAPVFKQAYLRLGKGSMVFAKMYEPFP